jgi:nitroreductase
MFKWILRMLSRRGGVLENIKKYRSPMTRFSRALAGNQSWAAGAPVILVALGNAAVSPSWWQNDVGISFEHIMLTAANKGLGTCWMGSMQRDAEIKELLGVL